MPTPRGSYLVATILAVGMATAINVFSVAVLTDAIFGDAPGLSENATQILTGWGGGIIGVIGAVVGWTAGAQSATAAAADAHAQATQAARPPAPPDHSRGPGETPMPGGRA